MLLDPDQNCLKNTHTKSDLLGKKKVLSNASNSRKIDLKLLKFPGGALAMSPRPQGCVNSPPLHKKLDPPLFIFFKLSKAYLAVREQIQNFHVAEQAVVCLVFF